MGFGRPPTAIGPERLEHGRTSFGPSLCVVADALGTPLDGLEAGGEMAVARRDVEIAAGPIAAGTVGAQRISVTGLRSGQPFLQFTATWYCTTDIEADWHLGATGLRGRGGRRCPLGRGHAVPGHTRRDGCDHPQLHRQPGGQCRGPRVRSGAGHSPIHRSAAAGGP